MGISDFYNLLRQHAPGSMVKSNLSEFSGISFAIDVSVYLYKFVRTAGLQRWVDLFIIFLCYLKKYNIRACCVFDGPNPPVEKKMEQLRRRQESEKIKQKLREEQRLLKLLEETYLPNKHKIDGDLRKQLHTLLWRRGVNLDSIVDTIQVLKESIKARTLQTLPITPDITVTAKNIVRALGLACIEAPGEAETMCANLCVHGCVDAVMTEDTDVLVYGTPYMVSKVDIKNGDVLIMSYKDIIAEMDFTPEQFTDMCILLGCDYNDRVKNYGLVKAYNMLVEHGSIEMMEGYMKGDSSVLNYKRCRELFTVAKHVKPVLPLNKAVDESLVMTILAEYKSNISIDYIRNAWKGAKIVKHK
jgi:flap endonuclease-1